MLDLKYELILASKSPRRSQLLSQAGIPFEVRTKDDVDESYPADLPRREVAEYIARKKANACKDLLKSDKEILLTADSIVVLGDTIYEKPVDADDAFRILESLAGQRHTVYTGVCLTSHQKQIAFSGISHVHFSPISEEEIRYYIDKYEPYDKAGAYAIQEWIGLCKIRSIDGTYANIMGLPVNLLYQELLHWED